jgi:hypothetical protein
VPRLDELRVAAGAIERAQEPVDAVSGVAEDPVDAPAREALENEVGDVL